MQDYIAERRRGEEAASGMLHTIEEALIRILDRIDAMEAPARRLAPTDGNAAGQDGMDAESDRLAEAYASGARMLGQKPSQADARCGRLRPAARRARQRALEPAAGGRRRTQSSRERIADAPGAARVRHAGQAEGPGRARGADCSRPREPTTPMPTTGRRQRQTARAGGSSLPPAVRRGHGAPVQRRLSDRRSLHRARRRSRRAAASRQRRQSAGRTAPPTRPSPRRHEAPPTSIAEPQTGKSAIAPPSRERGHRSPVPVPQPAERKTPAPCRR